MQGDTVEWQWTSPLADKLFSIYEVESVQRPLAVPSGFSAPASSQGRFSKQFPEPGNYFYASATDYVMIGSVRVLPFGDCLTDVVVREDSPITTTSVSCPAFQTCSEWTNVPALNDHHMFALRACLTPVVNTFSPRNGSADTIINIDAKDLSTCVELIEIRVGGALCELLTDENSPSSSPLNCRIGDSNAVEANLLAGSPLWLDAVYKEAGSAIVLGGSDPLDRIFFFLPQISSQNEVQAGSVRGGGTLIIVGSGFATDQLGHVRVTLGPNRFPCVPLVLTSGQITCNILPIDPNVLSRTVTTEAAINIDIFNPVTREWIPVTCSTPTRCVYIFSTAMTPKVNLVEPLTVTTSTVTLTLSGDNLLLDSETTDVLSILVGEIPCTQVSINADGQSITCVPTMPLPYGYHSLKVINHVRGGAIIAENLIVTSKLNVEAVTPSLGSFAGGTLICLTGNGLDAANLTVHVDQAICSIPPKETRTSDRLYCLTPASTVPSDGTTTKIVMVTAEIAQTSNSSQLANAFTYSSDCTPSISGASMTVITVADGSKTHQITIAGTLLTGDSTGNVLVTLDSGIPCQVTEQTETSVVCTTNDLPWGQYSVILTAPGFGQALSTAKLTVPLQLTSIGPSASGLLGNQKLSLQGVGFAGVQSRVTICNRVCASVKGKSMFLECTIPGSDYQSDIVCDVTVNAINPKGDTQTTTLGNAFSYLIASTPTVSSVQPLIGGTAGGTLLTIQGTLFGSDPNTLVDIGGTMCTIESQSSKIITCRTGAHVPAGKVPVNVVTGDNGRAVAVSYLLNTGSSVPLANAPYLL
ncbi:unnamed protein product [Echinostoma caproni]|uniref:IPT/TIG domain-containing protein n=1 Tax=Echinostoma caproni TaxID=27848 RepID=A0A183AVI3_9TREM|nr:unnamed protein product [Echinostoma caproni]